MGPWSMGSNDNRFSRSLIKEPEAVIKRFAVQFDATPYPVFRATSKWLGST